MATIVGKDSSIAKRCTCRHCAAIIEYLPLDVVQDWSTDYTGGRDEYSYVKCPGCNHQVTVSRY